MNLPSLLSTEKEKKKTPIRVAEKIKDVSLENYVSAFPSELELKKMLGDAYVINQPVDRVGGDGYWLHQREDKTFLIVFDCMGHGRLATMMNRFYLKTIHHTIVEAEVTDPSEILITLHKEIETQFKDKQSKLIGTGADIGVLILDRQTNTINYAGAKMDLVTVSGDCIDRIKGNRKSVGEYFEYEHSYETIELPVVQNQKLYLFSDGITDLFGGPRNKKLGFKNFSRFLQKASAMNMGEEKKFITQELAIWASDNDPLDDLLLVGLQAL